MNSLLITYLDGPIIEITPNKKMIRFDAYLVGGVGVSTIFVFFYRISNYDNINSLEVLFFVFGLIFICYALIGLFLKFKKPWKISIDTLNQEVIFINDKIDFNNIKAIWVITDRYSDAGNNNQIVLHSYPMRYLPEPLGIEEATKLANDLARVLGKTVKYKNK